LLPLSLDHLLIAVRDLNAASENYQRLLGRKPSWHGNHPTYGTANVLFRIDNTYIELLAPTQETRDTPWNRRLVAHLDERGEGLFALALGTVDVAKSVDEIRANGIHIDDPVPGDGVDNLTGARREWTNARMPENETRGVPAFVIQHRSPPEALPVAEPGADASSVVNALDHVVIGSSNLPETLTLWRDNLGADLRHTLDRGGRALHFLLLGTPGARTSCILELAGETEPRQPGPRDTLYGVAYRVPDVHATVERLHSAGVDISDPREGNAPGTIVADLKPGFSHDVRTLFIQKDVT
jgi:catechol 2,3-dioxygenase-like lactoylglutathione lyase family enzyme